MLRPPIDEIIIHCAATPNGKVYGNVQRNAAEIVDYWHSLRGFKRRRANYRKHNAHLQHIGYHFVIDADGSEYSGRAIGEVGAHTKGFNSRSIGICMFGTDAFTNAQWQTLYERISALSHLYPNAMLSGHRDHSPDLNGDGTIEPREYTKICPGFNVSEWVDNDLMPLPDHVCKIAGVQ